MLLGYGREFELEADEVGLRYAHRAGYDPRRMVAFLRILRRKEIMRGQSSYHGFEATHPDTAQRIAKADTMASLMVEEGGALEVRADPYRAALEGLRYGEARDQRRLRIYTVKAGDTLASIAREQMQGEGERYELASLNGLADDARLDPGTRLKLIVKSSQRDLEINIQGR
jgi:predicted Zn-dependent protease